MAGVLGLLCDISSRWTVVSQFERKEERHCCWVVSGSVGLNTNLDRSSSNHASSFFPAIAHNDRLGRRESLEIMLPIPVNISCNGDIERSCGVADNKPFKSEANVGG